MKSYLVFRIGWILILQRILNKEFEDMLEKYGGLYKPSFSNQNIFDSQEHKSGWSKLLGILKSDPTNENTLTTIKKLKGQKKVIELVQNHKLKELMLQNDNILKWFVYDNLVSYPNKDMSKRVCKVNQHPSKRDTKEMVWTFQFFG